MSAFTSHLANSSVDVGDPLIWADHPDPIVRGAVAARAGIPDELLRRFATDPSPHVAFQVAKNPDAPADVLAALADHPDTYVRGAVAEHPATPSAILTAWADGSRPEPAAHIVSTAAQPFSSGRGGRGRRPGRR